METDLVRQPIKIVFNLHVSWQVVCLSPKVFYSVLNFRFSQEGWKKEESKVSFWPNQPLLLTKMLAEFSQNSCDFLKMSNYGPPLSFVSIFEFCRGLNCYYCWKALKYYFITKVHFIMKLVLSVWARRYFFEIPKYFSIAI